MWTIRIIESVRIYYPAVTIFILLLAAFVSSYGYSDVKIIASRHYLPVQSISTNDYSSINIQTNRTKPAHSIYSFAQNSMPEGIRVGSEPRNIIVNPYTNMIYVANYLSDTVSVIDGNSLDHVIANISVGRSPAGLAIDLSKNLVYVSNERLNSVSVIDGRTNQVKSTFTVGLSPTSIAINPLTNRIYVVSSLTHSITIVDGETYSLLKMVTVGKSPSGLGINPVTNTLYVANKDSNTTTVIDGRTNTVVTNIPVGHSPY